MILNLKFVNKECYTQHLKMESIRNTINTIKLGMFLASLDIKDAFYYVRIHKEHRSFLKSKCRPGV